MELKEIQEDIIKEKLKSLFGIALGGSIYTRGLLATSSGKTEKEKLSLMVEKICANDKVIAMLGQAGTESQRKEWLATLS